MSSFFGPAVGEVILQEEPSAARSGRMRIRAPFYVGDSLAQAPGFEKRILFPSSLLPSIVDGMRQQIAEGVQPVNVYARHAHAAGGKRLPVGAVVGVDHDGQVGWVEAEIEPTEDDGKNVQVLVKGKKLNAMSLRAPDFEFEPAVLNDEGILVCTGLRVSGVDFAPDAPAMPTYGVQLLTQEEISYVTADTTSGDMALVPGLHSAAAARAAGKASGDTGEDEDEERRRKDRLTRPNDAEEPEQNLEVSMDIDRFLDEASSDQIKRVRAHPRVRGRAVEQEVTEVTMGGLAVPPVGIALEGASVEERIGALLAESGRQAEQRVATGGSVEMAGGLAVPQF